MSLPGSAPRRDLLEQQRVDLARPAPAAPPAAPCGRTAPRPAAARRRRREQVPRAVRAAARGAPVRHPEDRVEDHVERDRLHARMDRERPTDRPRGELALGRLAHDRLVRAHPVTAKRRQHHLAARQVLGPLEQQQRPRADERLERHLPPGRHVVPALAVQRADHVRVRHDHERRLEALEHDAERVAVAPPAVLEEADRPREPARGLQRGGFGRAGGDRGHPPTVPTKPGVRPLSSRSLRTMCARPGRQRLVHGPGALGEMGRLDPATGEAPNMSPLGDGSAPHGVIVGPDGAPWITDGGLNAIVRVDPSTHAWSQRFPLPAAAPGREPQHRGRSTLDGHAVVHRPERRLRPARSRRPAACEVFDAPRGPGPYGITATPDGERLLRVAGRAATSARIDRAHRRGHACSIRRQRGQGARRVWSDSRGRIWVSEWNAGQVGSVRPGHGRAGGNGSCPGDDAADLRRVRRRDATSSGSPTSAPTRSSRFDPVDRALRVVPRRREPNASVRQLLGRPGEVWGAESGDRPARRDL